MPKGRQVTRPVAERFWEKVDRSGECWEWKAFIHPKGYGMFGVRRRVFRAHRVAYELTHDYIPAGLSVCHTCDNRRCVRPDHLFLGTTQDNTADMVAKGRNKNPRADAERVQTHCLRGHAYTPENTKRHQGKRSCAICRRQAVREYRKRQRDKQPARAVA